MAREEERLGQRSLDAQMIHRALHHPQEGSIARRLHQPIHHRRAHVPHIPSLRMTQPYRD